MNTPLPALTSTSIHAGKPRDSAASSAALVRRWARVPSSSWTTSPGRTLACFGARYAETHAIGDRIEAALEQLQQVFAGLSLLALGITEHFAELALEYAVDAADFLLLAQLGAITGESLAGLLAVLAGSIGAALDGTFVSEALLAFEEELFALAAALAALGI